MKIVSRLQLCVLFYYLCPVQVREPSWKGVHITIKVRYLRRVSHASTEI